MAATIGTIQTSGTGSAVTVDSTPVVTAILSQPGTVNGLSYTNWAVDVQDSTGAMFLFGKSLPGYTPTVGDTVTATGTYSPYHQLPELGTITSINKSGTAAVPAIPVTTIPTVDKAPLPLGAYSSGGVAGYVVELDNVTISGLSGSFGAGNLTGTITDSSNNSMTFYYWPTSYSVENANLFGTTVPTGPVNMTGFVSVYGSNPGTPEFTPLTIFLPRATWSPSASNSNWDGVTGNWSTSAGTVASTTNYNATFDNTGLGYGSLVSISGSQNAQTISVSNSAGTTYTFSGGTVSANQLNVTGGGALLVNTALQAPVSVTAGTLGGTGSITGSLSAGANTVITPGSLTTPGNLTINGNVNLSNANYAWKLGKLADSNSGGTAGTDWDLLTLSGGSLALSGSSTLTLNFVNGINSPNTANAFWTASAHSWPITSGAGASNLISISNPTFTDGYFNVGLSAGDEILTYTPFALGPRVLTWSNGASAPRDMSGNWTANWAIGSGSTATAVAFDSTRPDNAAFGASSGGTGNSLTVALSGTAAANTFTFNANSAAYTLNGGTLTVMNGGTANQSATINSAVVLGNQSNSQTWNVASGTLAANGGIGESGFPVSLTKAGSGTLALGGTLALSGTMTVANGALSVTTDNAIANPIPLSLANLAQFNLNGHPAQIGALSGSGAVSLGGGTLTLGDASDATFAGTIQGNGGLIKNGTGWQALAGTNSFNGPISVTAGELQAWSDANLGNAANTISLSNSAAVGFLGSFTTNRGLAAGSNSSDAGTVYVSPSNSVTLTGQVSGGALIKLGGGSLVLANTANSYGQTVMEGGLLAFASSGSVGSGQIAFASGGTLQFRSSMAVNADIQFPSSGSYSSWIDTQGNNVTFNGSLGSNSGTGSLSFDKTGAGTLTLAGANYDFPVGISGTTYIHQGTVKLSGAVAFGSGYVSQLDSGNIEVRSGAALQLDNVQLGLAADSATKGIKLGFVDLYDGATLKASGTSSYANGYISPVLNYSSGAYSAGSGTIQTVNPSDVLSILSPVRQYDPNYNTNNYGNAITTGSATYANNPNQLTTLHISGPGRVQLQDGGVSSNQTFGGEWSVDSGVLQVGPYPQSTGVWNGPYGQLLNALGFKTLDGQTYTVSGSVQGDPDMPNGVTVNPRGMFVVAVDQVNTNPAITSGPVNDTPDYLRNPITLSGGTLAASGFEADMSNGFAPTSTAVTAKLGGNFTVSPGTSTIATFDTIGSTGARTVQLLGGSRFLYKATAAYAASTTITYSTNWDGTLNVDGGTAGGGEFDIFRDPGGTISVAPGANINILHGATVNVGGTELTGALSDGTNSVNFTAGTGGGHLVFSRNADMTYAGNITGGIDLTKSGTGTLELSGINDYTGATYVASGMLKIDTSSSLPDGGELIVGDKAAFGSPAPVAQGATAVSGAPAAVPEPGSIALLLAAAGCIAGMWQRGRSRNR